jgi:ABC-type polysaccharide/polyol phosphate export permease
MRQRLARAREVLLALTAAEIRQERQFSATGIVKWMIEPLAFMLVYYLFVVVILQRGKDQPGGPAAFFLFVLCALVPFRYFTGVTNGAMNVVQSYSQALQNRSFPRILLPLVLMLSEGVGFLVGLTLFLPFMAAFRILPTLAMLWLPVLMAVLALLCAGPAYLFAVFGLYLPDFRGMLQNLIRAGFFLSTGLLKGNAVPRGKLSVLIHLNPLSGIFDSFRAVIMRGRAPRALDVLYPLALGIILLFVGLAVYRWREHELPKEV